MTRGVVVFGLLILVVLRDDFWLTFGDARVLGLPAALAYHVGLCIAASALMWLYVRFSWDDEGSE